MTGMDRSNVHRAVKELGRVVMVKAGDPRKNQASEYRLNIEISDPDLVSLRQQGVVSTGQQPVVRPVVTAQPSKETQRKSESGAHALPRFPRKGPVRKAAVKDIGWGMVEVDGLQLDRRIYEKRYGQAGA